MRPRAFTLLEVVLTLTLFVMVMSLVGPALLRRIAPVTFDSAVEQTETALRIAREDARRRGEVLFVYAEPPEFEGDPYLIVSRNRLLETVSETGSAGFGAGPTSEGPAGRGRGGQAGADRSGGLPDFDPSASDDEDGDELLTLPPRIRVTSERPEIEADGPRAGLGRIPGASSERRTERPETASGSAAGIGVLGFGAGADTEPILVAVFIPDGTVVAGGPVWLADDDGRAAELRVRPAIGRLSFVRPASPGSTDASLEPDPFERAPTPPAGVSAGGVRP